MTHLLHANITLYFLLLTSALHSQTNSMVIPGEYHLRGVMETASGFRFNADSTFDFYFSYGAVDREGHGRWRSEGNTVILDSPVKTEPDFKLKEKRAVRPANTLTIQITDPNTQILGYVHARLKLADGSTVHAESDAAGKIVFNLPGKAVEFSLLHALWPNEPVPFPLVDPTVNHFEFTINPQIVLVEFKNFVLRGDGANLVGGHPLMEEEEFLYERRR